MQSGHYNLYANRGKEEYDALFEDMLASVDGPVSRFEFWRMLQRFTAYGNVAHAKIDFPNDAWGDFREQGGKAFPIYLRIVDGRAYVRENYSTTVTLN